jgi:hypothetical protein
VDSYHRTDHRVMPREVIFTELLGGGEVWGGDEIEVVS